MRYSQEIMKDAVNSGYWPLYRYNPSLEEGKRFSWDVRSTPGSFQDFIRAEVRYSSLFKTNPKNAEALFARAEEDAKRRMDFYQKIGPLM